MALYSLAPVNLIPDFIPVAGVADDLVVNVFSAGLDAASVADYNRAKRRRELAARLVARPPGVRPRHRARRLRAGESGGARVIERILRHLGLWDQGVRVLSVCLTSCHCFWDSYAMSDTSTESSGVSPWLLFLAALTLSSMMGVLDWASGYELQFFVFYFIPITLAGWNCGLLQTLIVSALCGGLWYSIDVYSGHPYSSWFYGSWSAIIRISSFLINGYSVVRIRDLLQRSNQTKADLQRALAEIKTLEQLLPICATCKRLRNDDGYLLQIEEYLNAHAAALHALGHCDACAAKAFRDTVIEAAGARSDADHVYG